MKTSLRSLVLTLLAGPALVLPAVSVAAVDEAPDRLLTVGTDIAAGWLWAGGAPEGCAIGQSHDDGISASFVSSNTALLFKVKPSGVLEVTGCGNLVPVSEMPRTTTRKRVTGDGAWVVGAHFVKGGVYVGRPTEDSVGYESGTAPCRWGAHTSYATAAGSSAFPDREGRLRITRRMKAVKTWNDCVWKRIS